MKKPKSAAPTVTSLPPRNRHTGRYDFAELSRQLPLLAAYVGDNGHGEDSIDFSDPHAVRALNRALLKSQYGIANWDIPAGFLVPPIPGVSGITSAKLVVKTSRRPVSSRTSRTIGIS